MLMTSTRGKNLPPVGLGTVTTWSQGLHSTTAPQVMNNNWLNCVMVKIEIIKILSVQKCFDQPVAITDAWIDQDWSDWNATFLQTSFGLFNGLIEPPGLEPSRKILVFTHLDDDDDDDVEDVAFLESAADNRNNFCFKSKKLLISA